MLFEDAEIGNAHSVVANSGFPASFVVDVRQVGRVGGKGRVGCDFSPNKAEVKTAIANGIRQAHEEFNRL